VLFRRRAVYSRNTGQSWEGGSSGQGGSGRALPSPQIGRWVTPRTLENRTVELRGAFTDPGKVDAHTITVDWGDGTVDTWTLRIGGREIYKTHQYLDDPSAPASSAARADLYTVKVAVADDDSGIDTGVAVTEVRNVAPVITSLGNSSPGVGGAGEGDEVRVWGEFQDPGTLDVHRGTVDWGDGSAPEPVAIVESGGAGSLSASHVYRFGGIYNIQLALSDDDGGTTRAATTAVICGAGVHSGVLQIVGTGNDDRVEVSRLSNSQIKVEASFFDDSTFVPASRVYDVADVRRIDMALGAGDDFASIAWEVDIPALVEGGGGKDTLLGGGASNILLGGEGADDLVGGRARDVLIGGTGGDLLRGDAEEDILINGWTAYDRTPSAAESVFAPLAHRRALLAVLAEWNSDRPFDIRLRNLVDGSGSNDRLNGNFFLQEDATGSNRQTVFHDGDVDTLYGDGGVTPVDYQDWILSGDHDVVIE